MRSIALGPASFAMARPHAADTNLEARKAKKEAMKRPKQEPSEELAYRRMEFSEKSSEEALDEENEAVPASGGKACSSTVDSAKAKKRLLGSAPNKRKRAAMDAKRQQQCEAQQIALGERHRDYYSAKIARHERLSGHMWLVKML